jgi:hypothetical protein
MTENAFDIGTLLGPEPAWLTCACGAVSARTPCFDCTIAEERRADEHRAEVLAVGSIPRAYSARLGSPELARRVRYQGDLKTLSGRILGAANVCFVGDPGTGKTTLAAACLRERLPHCLFVSALDLAVSRSQHSLGDGEASLVERAKAARLLLIDDVGQGHPAANDAVRPVVFHRYDADLPTWTTTGLDGKAVTALYGAGFLRRIAGVGRGGLVVQLGEPKAQGARS